MKDVQTHLKNGGKRIVGRKIQANLEFKDVRERDNFFFNLLARHIQGKIDIEKYSYVPFWE